MIEFKSRTKGYGINFPESIKEFTPELLESITSNINLPEYYAVVMLCFEEKLFNFASTIVNKSKPNTTSVTPLLVKMSKESLTKNNARIGDKLIVSASSLERGHHIHIPIMISSGNAGNYFKQDEIRATKIIAGKKPVVGDCLVKDIIADKEINVKKIIIVEFKIIPIPEIVAYIPMNDTIIDPFKTKGIELAKAEFVN